ncbi:MAG: ABC transporter ATP-binding protein [Saprospiraceae bacterium]|nr:ABC transporter ATP-binding protein [Saprospiraceae bacterium]
MSVIKVENLSKKYIIDHEGQERYTAMRDVVARKVKKIFSYSKSLRTGSSASKEAFYALKDINFEIKQGDRVGIIGRNGAGKSTLLKVLSRITEPTTGKIIINGRVASLLEVGTGFHPELTGRENIYLNGAILGMSRAEIKKHFEAIVDFSGVEKFLDTPVKRYSSGMYVRLAFAVAAHLEPEILIIDEVLAVGDAEFQKKCLGKMEEVSKGEGRTIIFVSHNMTAIRTLCNKGILLTDGQLGKEGEINSVLLSYKTIVEKRKIAIYNNDNKILNGSNISSASIKIKGNQPFILLEIELKMEIVEDHKDCILVFDILNTDGICVFQSMITLKDHLKIENWYNNFIVEIELFGIVIDFYTFNISLCTKLFQNIVYIKDKLFFDIVDSPVKEKFSFDYKGSGNGFVYPITRVKHQNN